MLAHAGGAHVVRTPGIDYGKPAAFRGVAIRTQLRGKRSVTTLSLAAHHVQKAWMTPT